MKRYLWLFYFLLPLQLIAQDTTLNDLMKDMEPPKVEKKAPVKIFSSERVINANTTEMVGKGKMDFRISHNFDDIDGHGASIPERFLGLDNARDIRIGFHIGITNNFDVSIARLKGAGAVTNNASGSVTKLLDIGFKIPVHGAARK